MFDPSLRDIEIDPKKLKILQNVFLKESTGEDKLNVSAFKKMINNYK